MSEQEALPALRRYTRLTLLTTVPVVGLAPLLVTLANEPRWPRLPVLAVGVVVLLAVHWRRVARAVDEPAEVLPWRRSAVTLVVAVVLMGYAYSYADPGNALWAFLPATALAELQVGRAPGPGWRLLGWLAAGIGVLVGVLAAVTPAVHAPPVAAGVIAAVVLLMLPFAEVVALRQWRIALELDQARRDAAELGATRERLRFAEDLHDILGHALEVVSLKSELATRLSAVDPERANAEMAEVHRLARGALRDVRGLAHGRLPTDLETELTGARTLLSSAGIECVVDGQAAGGAHSELFGRVLREAVTNLLRHADTRRCWVTVRAAALTVINDGVTNDGVVSDQPVGTGTGLAGLRRRVVEAGGSLTAGPGARPGTFEVAVVLA